MASVTNGYTFTGTTDPITFGKLNLLGQPTVTIGTSEITTSMLSANCVTVAKLAALSTNGALLGSPANSTTTSELRISNIGSALHSTTIGLTFGDSAANSSIVIGQSSTGKFTTQWTYNATPASGTAALTSTGLLALTSAGQMSLVYTGHWQVTMSSAFSIVDANLTQTVFNVDALDNVALGAQSNISTSATDGFVYVKGVAGKPTGTPSSAPTGLVPMLIDTTNSKFWAYISGAWTGALLNGVGFTTGVGGTVTQATSKATAFTLSKVCGQITTASDALNAATIVSATWTNSFIAATDVVLINHVSGGTSGAYTFNVQCGAGTATLTIRNNTAGNLSEALVLSFVVIKSVTS